MASVQPNRAPWELPESYRAIPVSDDQGRAAMRLCAVVRDEPDAVAGALVVQRDSIDARVVLGCLCDAGGRVHEWVELWIQDLDGLGETTQTYREALSNAVFDDRWRRQVQAFVDADPDGVILTGWEHVHPTPSFLDPSEGRPVALLDPETNEPWTLCTDDALLTGAGLPPYGASLHRYLHVAAAGNETSFVPVTRDAPRGERIKELEALLGKKPPLPLNPGGGFMLVRRHDPLGFEEFVDLVGGKEWSGPMHGRTPLDLGAAAQAMIGRNGASSQDGERLFLGAHGRWGRLVESMHLKLRALADAVSSVRSIVEQTSRPVLNLSADSFRVRLSAPGAGLPTFWTSRVRLVEAGHALSLPVSAGAAPYFLRGRSAVSIYFPGSASAEAAGRGMVRIRRVVSEGKQPVVVEGTLVTQERVAAAAHDLLWLRMNLKAGRTDLYGQVEPDTALAAGEWRFRTIGQSLAKDVVAQLKEAEGVPMRDTSFEVIPLLSTPCDLYALAVLAARTLLVNSTTSLPVALDELMSLARAADQAYDEESKPSLQLRIEGIFDGDARWRESLGPQQLLHEPPDAADAAEIVPPALWWDTLALIIRMLPGSGHDSQCRDLGDADPAALHAVFDRVLDELQSLITRTRSLIVIDWKFNREVHSVIRDYLSEDSG